MHLGARAWRGFKMSEMLANGIRPSTFAARYAEALERFAPSETA